MEGEYRQTVEGAVVALEPHTGWRQGIHWAVSAFLAIFDGDSPESAPRSAKVVIRRSDSGRVLYSEGPFDSEVAQLVAEEAVRVIRVWRWSGLHPSGARAVGRHPALGVAGWLRPGELGYVAIQFASRRSTANQPPASTQRRASGRAHTQNGLRFFGAG